MLKVDDDGKSFISRGNKKRYFLEDSFVYKYLVKNPTIKEDINNIYLHEIKELLKELLNNYKLGNKTRSALTRVDELVNRLL